MCQQHFCILLSAVVYGRGQIAEVQDRRWEEVEDWSFRDTEMLEVVGRSECSCLSRKQREERHADTAVRYLQNNTPQWHLITQECNMNSLH